MQATFFSGFSDTSEALDFMLENIHSNFQIGNKVFLNLDNNLLAKFEDLKRKKFQILKFFIKKTYSHFAIRIICNTLRNCKKKSNST